LIAIDTNVVVRLLTNDDPVQVERASILLEEREIFIPTTVFLEAAWVLKKGYAFDNAAIADGFLALAGQSNVTVEQPERLALALGWVRSGVAFADAFHLACAAEHEGFATFDRRLVRKAAELKAVLTVEP
jgi:predicted nucleic-acid-binding protein